MYPPKQKLGLTLGLDISSCESENININYERLNLYVETHFSD